MIEVKNLVKNYGRQTALDGVTFSVKDGEILGFLGPNGAGKSTTMNIITGYISATDGTVLIDGIDILEEPKKAKSKIGYLPEIPPVYGDMTVEGYLKFMFDIKKLTLPKKEHILEVSKLVGVDKVSDRLIKHLSKGYRQRVGFAQALLGNPPVLILDEPTVGLDPNQIIEMRNLIRKLGKKHTVILSSHVLSEVQATCDRIVVINKGKIVADDMKDSMTSRAADNKLVAVIEGREQGVISAIRNISGVVNVRKTGEPEHGCGEYTIECKDEADIRRALKLWQHNLCRFLCFIEMNIPLKMYLSSLHRAKEEINNGRNIQKRFYIIFQFGNRLHNYGSIFLFQRIIFLYNLLIYKDIRYVLCFSIYVFGYNVCYTAFHNEAFQ